MGSARRENRGPLAAADNRRALLRAAREVFAELGFEAPLSAVARRAGVGQGTLYRHFADRVALALAVFADDVAELEDLARRPGAALQDVLEAATEQVLASVAFVDLLAVTHDDRVAEVAEGLRTLLSPLLAAAQEEGRLRSDLAPEHVLLALGMVAGAVARAVPAERRTAAATAWRLLRQGMENP